MARGKQTPETFTATGGNGGAEVAQPDVTTEAKSKVEGRDLAAEQAAHNARMLATFEAGFVVQGLRAVNPANVEEGMVVTFTPDEQAKMTAAVVKIIEARG